LRNLEDVKCELDWAIGRLEQYARLVEFLSHEHSCLIKEQQDQEKCAATQASNLLKRIMK
jgi:hypothetical protein